MGSLAVYGAVLAGWISNNKFAMFGGLRASAQMISYEVTLGLSLVGVLAVYQTLDLNEIINQQSTTTLGGLLPRWGIFLNPIGFIIFFVSLMAETKRAPFDMPESESELVAGYFTEYSGMKFLLFWLGEFSEIVCCICFDYFALFRGDGIFHTMIFANFTLSMDFYLG
jgi:NADH-quinone oxidoreductase subunit H